MDRMRNATFCLSMPGDSASTRRLSETIMAGCIPVFIGDPACPALNPQMSWHWQTRCKLPAYVRPRPSLSVESH